MTAPIKVRVLLIWEEVPESIKTYYFPADAAMMKWLSLCHRNFINTEHSDKVEVALLKLQEFLVTIEPKDDAKPFEVKDCTVILSGFVL